VGHSLAFKKIAKGAGLIFLGIFISKLLGYIYRLIIARIGTELYGLFNLGLAVYSFALSFALFGVHIGALRFISFYKGRNQREKEIGTIFTASQIILILSIIVSLLLIIGSKFIAHYIFKKDELRGIILILAFVLPLNSLSELAVSIMRAYNKIEYEVFTKNIFENLVKIIFTFIFLFLGMKLLGLTIAFGIAIALTTFMLIFLVFKKIIKKIPSPLSTANYSDILKLSWPLSLAGFTTLILTITDTLMLGFFRASSEVGVYNAAVPTAQLLFIVPFAFMILFIPVLTELFAKSEWDEFRNSYLSTSKWISLLNIPILFFLITFSSQILNILFGKDYVGGATALTLLSLGMFFVHSSSHSRGIFTVIGKTRTTFINTIIVALFNVTLNLFLIPSYGINGAALATSLSLLLLGFLFFVQSALYTRIFPVKFVHLKMLVVGLISTFIIYYISLNWIIIKNIFYLMINFVIFIVVYFILLLVSRSLDNNDLLIIRSLVKRFMINKSRHR